MIRDLSDLLATCGGEKGEVGGDTPHPGKGLRSLHFLSLCLWVRPLTATNSFALCAFKYEETSCCVTYYVHIHKK